MKQFEEKTAISYFVSDINAKNVQMNGNRRKMANEYKGMLVLVTQTFMKIVNITKVEGYVLMAQYITIRITYLYLRDTW